MTSSITRAYKIFHQLFALPKQHRVEVVDVVALLNIGLEPIRYFYQRILVDSVSDDLTSLWLLP